MKIENGDGANPFLFVLLRTSPRANYWVYFHKIGRDGASGPPPGDAHIFCGNIFIFLLYGLYIRGDAVGVKTQSLCFAK